MTAWKVTFRKTMAASVASERIVVCADDELHLIRRSLRKRWPSVEIDRIERIGEALVLCNT